jgi:hypothetical protein
VLYFLHFPANGSRKIIPCAILPAIPEVLGAIVERSTIMDNENSISNQNRRQSCSIEESGTRSQEESEKHRFQNELSQTYENAFRWRFDYYTNIMQRFADYLGRDKLLEMIQCAVDENNKRIAIDNPEHSLASFVEYGKEAYENMLTYEIIEETDKVYEMKVTECLWAKTFRDQNAADIGYATICHGDFSEARAYHPKLKLERTKTLMQGHDCCNHRWTWEA